LAIGDNQKEALLDLLHSLMENGHKILHHGHRADAIVKNMLVHSQSGSGKRELTNINALAEEYLRMTYHGLRAKDKSFNAILETHFDERANGIYVIPQDIGRVLINLFNNAFYSVNEKKKQRNGTFEPMISVSTRKTGNKVEIAVKDNGIGIPQMVKEKVFQPFFTTKPTGEGTGLGLSLSYDIVTKGHNGEIKLDSKEGEYAVFKIILPASTNPVNSTIENT
jgi:signal transduction histidine kinase